MDTDGHLDPEQTSTLQKINSLLRRFFATENRDPITPAQSPRHLVEDLNLALPAYGNSETEVIEQLARVADIVPLTSGHRFFNQLFSGREPMALAGEMLAASMNHSMYTYKAAGVNILIERELIKHMGQFAGWNDVEGQFLPGGTIANLVGMQMARDDKDKEFVEFGTRSKPATFYTSEEAHYSIQRNAGILGIGRRHVRLIPVDERGGMRLDLLEESIKKDLAEDCTPTGVVGTAGTTVRGAYDPLDGIADIAQQYKMWFHVDGALGGTMLLHPTEAKKLAGVSRADSLSWNPHKLMGVPLPASVILTPHVGILSKTYNTKADYLFQQDEDYLNPGTQSIQCGRRNDALKLWAAWQNLGDSGWQSRIEKQVGLARASAQLIKSTKGLQLVEEPMSVTVCFTVDNMDAAKVCEELDSSGLAKIGWGIVKGEKVIRLTTINPEVTITEIERLLSDIKQTVLSTASRR